MLVHIARNLFSSIVMYNSSINFSWYVSNFRSNREKFSCFQFIFCILISCICEVTTFKSLRMTQLEVRKPAGWLLKKHKLATWTNLSWKLSKNTVICRNKTFPPTGAGIRPFLSGLYCHPGKIFDLFWLPKQLSVVFTYEMTYREVTS